jgi:hypothetical protein
MRAPEGSLARLLEDVLCNPADWFPRALCFFPFAIGLVFGFSFSLSTTLTAAPGVLPALAALGFLSSAAAAACVALGAPVCRQRGCVGSCAELAAAAAAPCPRCCLRPATTAAPSSACELPPAPPTGAAAALTAAEPGAV